jgi:uncharacterized protein (DUF2141 family)
MKINFELLRTALMLMVITAGMGACQNRAPQQTAATGSDTTAATASDTTAAPADTATAAALPARDTIAKRAPLTLTITNLATPDAAVTVGVYGTKNKFPDPKDQLKVYKFKPHGLKLTATITDLPFGTYAIAIYQDVKGTGKISKNFIGIPTDPYAFSRNYKPTVKAPNFNDCKFEYDAKANTIAMNMIR